MKETIDQGTLILNFNVYLVFVNIQQIILSKKKKSNTFSLTLMLQQTKLSVNHKCRLCYLRDYTTFCKCTFVANCHCVSVYSACNVKLSLYINFY